MKNNSENKLTAEMLENEYWWGGNIFDADKMPFDKDTVCTRNLLHDRRTQTLPFFLSSKGRYIWSEDVFEITFDKGNITACGRSEIVFKKCGDCLRDAYLAAMNAHFPFEKDMVTTREFYEKVQFNTWMEFLTNQTQDNILAYAHEIVDNGYNPGILMIDDGWQKSIGTWEFDPEKFQDPKKMMEELHALGFTVMLWVTPFMSMDTPGYRGLTSVNFGDGKRKHLVRTDDGKLAVFKWWNGYSGMLNLCLPQDREFLKNQLDRLINEYGADGFKFDGGAYRPRDVVSGECDGYNFDGYTSDMLNRAWLDFGRSYKFHEFKDTWKSGGLRIIQRLFDKNHAWEGNGIDCLIPGGIFLGIMGIPFISPDMVGGGECTTFISGNYDEELFVRMAQCSALFPMMQFSSLPWRHLSEESAKLCMDAAKLHESFSDTFKSLVENAEKTGEPVIRSMEYNYPNCGYEKINDQFMLGNDIIVAPVVVKGQRKKKVALPKGKWTETTSGKTYDGGCFAEVDAPIDKLPVFKRA